VLNDPECSIQLKSAGIHVCYADHVFTFAQSGRMRCSENTVAFELCYVLYEVFGEHLRTLSATVAEDIPAGKILELKELGDWSGQLGDGIYLQTVVAFVAHVRNTEERVWRCRPESLGEELARLALAGCVGVLGSEKEKGPLTPRWVSQFCVEGQRAELPTTGASASSRAADKRKGRRKRRPFDSGGRSLAGELYPSAAFACSVRIDSRFSTICAKPPFTV
jgi:hypothetical protein